jgi:hypothetical protein
MGLPLALLLLLLLLLVWRDCWCRRYCGCCVDAQLPLPLAAHARNER